MDVINLWNNELVFCTRQTGIRNMAYCRQWHW